jgi:hypothetical protein
MCHVVLAQPADIPAWLDLARQVEPLFGQWWMTQFSIELSIKTSPEGLHFVSRRPMSQNRMGQKAAHGRFSGAAYAEDRGNHRKNDCGRFRQNQGFA